MRARIVRALGRGRLEGAPRPSGWALLAHGPSVLRADEENPAARLSSR